MENKEQKKEQQKEHQHTQNQERHEPHHEQHHGKSWYDRNNKYILLAPAIALTLAIIYLVAFTAHNGDIFNKDVSLTGGTTISVFDSKADMNSVQSQLIGQFPDIQMRKISDISTGGQKGFSLETKAAAEEIQPALEKVLGYKLVQDNSSIEFSGATLSTGFYKQLIGAIEAAFLLMAWVVFIIFANDNKIKAIVTMLSFLGVSLVLPSVPAIKIICVMGILAGFIWGIVAKSNNKVEKWLFWGCFAASVIFFIFPFVLIMVPVTILLVILAAMYSMPSLAVVLCAFADLTMTVATVNLLGMSLSLAGIIAFLMLIGYSVDTDILLTSRLLKRGEGTTINGEIFGAFKTGVTMTLTAIAAVTVCLFAVGSYSETLRQIFTILLIGLGFDIFNTWITNASILKWFVEVRRR